MRPKHYGPARHLNSLYLWLMWLLEVVSLAILKTWHIFDGIVGRHGDSELSPSRSQDSLAMWNVLCHHTTKSLGLAVWEIPCIFCLSVNLELWPFDRKTGMRVIRVLGYLCANFELSKPFGSQLNYTPER